MRVWRVKRWGIVFTSGASSGSLIGEGWHDGYRNRRPLIEGETLRCLLFHTRESARKWCAEENASYAAYQTGHVCRQWLVRPVRVWDCVTPIRRAAK